MYRALDNLVRLGLARRVNHNGGAARFDGNVERHHHLHCVACDSITDVHWDSLDVDAFRRVSSQSFEVFDVSVSFEGVCQSCAHNQKS